MFAVIFGTMGPTREGGYNSHQDAIRGWEVVWGCTTDSLILFRVSLGLLLTLELLLRFRFLEPFYSDEGTLPRSLIMDKVDGLYRLLCLHCHFGALWQQQVLLSLQVVLSVLLMLGHYTQFVSIVSWYLYLSSTLRNTWLSYILDRYFHYLLFLSMFLPLNGKKGHWIISPGTMAIKLLVVWIYFDAGWGKYSDPLGGWSYSADPLPALDTYARHTMPARYLYAVLGPSGLRVMTPLVVYVELLATPVALLGSYLKNKVVVLTAVLFICAMHVGIAFLLNNAALLSFVACSPWCVILPLGWDRATSNEKLDLFHNRRTIIHVLLIGSMIAGNVWLESFSRHCDQSVQHVWPTVFHNRWNVFVGAEEYVTWEIAPGQLQDGSIVDVWGRRDDVDWRMPGTGAPRTATARPGRWRSFPYLAGLEGQDSESLWSYLCREWDRENQVDIRPSRKLMRFNFFMLQADVLPSMTFSATRKRLIHSYECPLLSEPFDGDSNQLERDEDSTHSGAEL